MRRPAHRADLARRGDAGFKVLARSDDYAAEDYRMPQTRLDEVVTSTGDLPVLSGVATRVLQLTTRSLTSVSALVVCLKNDFTLPNLL